MKLKLLTLLVAMGLFAFGADAAKEKLGGEHKQLTEPQLKDVAGGFFCSALEGIITNRKTWPQVCQDACSASGDPDIADLGPCAAAIVADNTDKHPLVEKVASKIKAACTPSLWSPCSGIPCNVDSIRKACGTICCQFIDPSIVEKNCLSKQKDSTCKSIKIESLSPEMTKATW